jgi:hypothetical protein
MGDYLHEIDDATTDANEAIRELADSVSSADGDMLWHFICECSDDDCLERVSLCVADYDSLRACGEPVLAHDHMAAATAARIVTLTA